MQAVAYCRCKWIIILNEEGGNLHLLFLFCYNSKRPSLYQYQSRVRLCVPNLAEWMPSCVFIHLKAESSRPSTWIISSHWKKRSSTAHWRTPLYTPSSSYSAELVYYVSHSSIYPPRVSVCCLKSQLIKRDEANQEMYISRFVSAVAAASPPKTWLQARNKWIDILPSPHCHIHTHTQLVLVMS